jgi:hypothetical protein
VGIATVIRRRREARSVIASGWGDQLVTIRALLLLGGVSLALAGGASAQSVNAPAGPIPPAALDPPATAPAPPPAALSAPPTVTAPAALNQPGMPPQRVRAIVRASGFDPIGPPVRRGNLYVQRALDPNAIEYRLVIDPLTGRTLSVRPMRVPGPYAYGPAPYRPYRPVYGRYYGPPPDDFGYGYGAPHPPRNIPTARLAPPQAQPQQQPQPQSQQLPPPQPSTTAQAPLPRPKPYVMEATGSIPIDAPQSPAPQKTPEPQKTSGTPAPQNNGAAAMPPVAPLD